MHLSRRTDYSFRLLILLGLDPDRTLAISETARRLGLSGNHLAKIAQDLARVGIVETVRGRAGGVRLTEEGLGTTVGEVIRALEPLAVVECFDSASDACRLSPACRLSGLLEAGVEAFLDTLDEVTVGDLCVRPTKLRRLLA